MRLIHRFLIAAALILSGLSAFAVEPIAVQRWSYKPRLEKPTAFLLSVPQYGAYLAAWPEGEYDRKRVLCIGNSFTF